MNTGVDRTVVLSHRAMCERRAAEGHAHTPAHVMVVRLNDGSLWQLNERSNSWVQTNKPDSTGTFKLMAGAL